VDIRHPEKKQLAGRWSRSEATLERWRTEGIGPKFLKLCGRVLYRLVDIETFQESRLSISTKPLARPVRVK
jgi:hypothetical protein